MSWIALAAAIALDLLATAGLMLLAARIYERSILHTGARVKLSHVLTTRSQRAKPTTRERSGPRPCMPPIADNQRSAPKSRDSPRSQILPCASPES